MKRVVIGIVAAVAVAFAAHAAYNNLVTDNTKTQSATAATQASAVAVSGNVAKKSTLQKADTKLVAATAQPTAPRAAANQTPAKKDETKKPGTTAKTTNRPYGTYAPAGKTAVSTSSSVTDNSFSNPDSVAEYDFAFVDPQAVADPMTNISSATEQAVQDVYEETVLSPSAPR